MKRRFVGVAGALALALIGTMVLVSYVNGAEDRALAGEKVVKVLVAAEPIEAGTPASELEGKLQFERVPQKVRAEGAVTSIGQLGERVTETQLVKGEQIVKSRFVEEPEAGTAVPGSTGEDQNLLQQTISVDPARAIGGSVKAGDIVAVVGSFDPFTDPSGAQSPNQTHILIHKVRVTNVQVGQSSSAAPVGGGDEEEGAEQAAPDGAFLITLSLSAPNVERLTFTAEFGHIWLAAEPKDADETGTKVVVLDNLWS